MVIRSPSRRLIAAALLFSLSLFACSDPYVPPSQSGSVSRHTSAPTELMVSKADFNRAGVQLGVELVELMPDESIDDAARRYFGVTPNGDVADLVDGRLGERPMPENEMTIETNVCVNSCVFAHDGVCDEPSLCAAGTDCNDCGGQSPEPAHEAPAASNDQPGDANTCRHAYDGECDEPTHCAPGTDSADCMDARGTHVDGPADDSCEFAFDDECDEGTWCDYGTDTTDCYVPKSAGPSGRPVHMPCFASGFEGVCTEGDSCDGAGVDGVCPGGDTVCCLKGVTEVPEAPLPGLGQSCTANGHDGICVGQGTCGGDGISGVCGRSYECCQQTSVQQKAVVSGAVAVAVGIRWAVFAYRTYRVARTAQTAIGVLRMLNTAGQTVQVGVSTDAGSISRARSGARTELTPTTPGQGVGDMTKRYFEARSAEATDDDALICPPAVKDRLQSEMHAICDAPGGACRPPSGESRDTYCPATRDRLQRAEQCLGMRQRITDECFGGLGHPDEDGNRTTEDRAMDNVRNRINKCLRQLRQHCGG